MITLSRLHLYFLLSFCFLLNLSAYSQDTLFFDKEWEELESLEGAAFYRITETAKENPDRGVMRTYYSSGQIRSEEAFGSLEKESKSGITRSWDQEGNLRSEISYFKGLRHGNLMTYWKNGQPRRKDVYVRGSLQEGTCWNEEGEEVAYFPYEVKPQYPGGLEALQKYLKENTVYPDEHVIKGETRVVVQFVIDKEGKITEIEVADTADKVLLYSAYLAVRDMPTWSPGYIDGEAVNVHYALPFVFRK